MPTDVKDAPPRIGHAPAAPARAWLAGRGPRTASLVALALVPLGFLLVFFLVPVVGMLGRGFVIDGSIDLSAFGSTLESTRIRRIIWLTLAQAVTATTIAVLVGVPLAFVLYRLSFPGRGLLRAIIAVPFVLPTVVVGVAFRTLLTESGPLGFLGLDGSWPAIIAGLVFFNISVIVRTVGTMWSGLDPRREQSASALGASPRAVFWTVTLPALAPAILSGASVVFLFCATAFGVVLTMGGLRYGTIETEIYLQTANFLNLEAAAVLSILQLVVVVGLLWVVGVARSRTEHAFRRTAREAVRRVRRSDAALLAVTALVVAFIVAPIASLVVRSLQRSGEWTLENYANLQSTGSESALVIPVWQAARNSLVIAANATVIAVVLGLIVAFVTTRRPRGRAARRLMSVFDGAFMLPLGVSAVTVGFGLLITLNRPPLDLRTSAILIPIAQAMVALPLVVRTIAPALRSIDDRQRQAALVLGAPYWRALVTVDLQVIWRPLLAAAGFALAVSMGEFGATAFLARNDTATLPVVIYRLIGRPGADNFGMAMAASVVLAAITVAIMGAIERLRVSSVGAF